MKRAVLVPLLLIAAACAGGRGSTPPPTPGHGAISIAIIPNPIVATPASGNTYSFPFEVVVRESGGRPVDIERITANVYALGTIKLGSESYDANEIRKLGYNPRVPAYGELRYRFTPQREVPDDRLFGGVSAELRVEGVDDTGSAVTAATSVTVKRN